MEEQSIAGFWTARATTFGHTGWSDPVVYAYDQTERLSLIGSAISGLAHAPGARALDFGCGTGDFSKLLLSLGYRVCGYDPFVKPRIGSSEFTYARSYDVIPGRRETDLALSVTVLDHILDEQQLSDALRTVAACLGPQGNFFMLEYAFDSDRDREKFGFNNDYQSFRTLNQWEQLLHAGGLSVVGVAPASHPEVNPSIGYLTYTRTPLARIRRRYPNLPLARTWCDPLLRRSAARLVRTEPPVTGPSVLKIIRCRLTSEV